MSHKTCVVLTIDTEPSVAGALEPPYTRRPLIEECVAGTVDGRSEALGFLVDTLVRHDLRATFFVEAIHTRALPEAAMGRYVDQLLAAGQDVQLHFHPVWRNWTNGVLDPSRRLTDASARMTRAELAEMLDYGAQQIARWTGERPNAARAGNFSTAMPVLDASADVGIGYTSHICLAHSPPAEPALQLAGGVHDIAGVCEVPVTCFQDRGLASRGLRPLQINAVSFAENRQVLSALHEAHAPIAVIVLHPFDFLKRDGPQFQNLRPHRLVQRRWAALCAFLASARDRFQTTSLADAARGLTPTPATIVSNTPVSGTMRAAANVLGDRFD